MTNKHATIFSLLLLPWLSATLYAQQIEEIIITSQRTSTELQSTPASVSVIQGEDLGKKGINSLSQLEGNIPNVSTNNTDRLQVVIRGITSNDFTEKGDPSASVMIDGIYIARPQAQNILLFDIQRIEFLRGPQGTLWGRNTTAGVINKLTANPVHERQGNLSLGFGSYDERNLNGMFNTPVSETIALRVAYTNSRRDGYAIDTATQIYSADPAVDRSAARLSALWDIYDNFNILVKTDYADDQGMYGGENAVLISKNYPAPIPGMVMPQIGNGASDMITRNWTLPVEPSKHNWTAGTSLEANWSLHDFDIVYMGSYRKLHRNEMLATPVAQGLTQADYRQNSQEIRVLFMDTGPLIGQAGLYYFEETSDITLIFDNFFIYLDDYNPNAYGFMQHPTHAKNSAAFTQITYAIDDQLNITAGMRYSRDWKTRNGGTVLATSREQLTIPEAIFWRSNHAENTWSRTTWRLGFDYHFNDTNMIFGSLATGYKAGGFNDGCEAGIVDDNGILCNQERTPDDLYYNPEDLTSYEAGTKSMLLKDSLRLNASVFYYDYRNMQLSGVAFINNAPQLVIVNAGQSTIKGLEVESKYLLDDKQTLEAAFSILDAQFNEYMAPVGNGETSMDFAGYDLDRAPRWTTSIAYSYKQSLQNLGNLTYKIRTFFSDHYVIANRATIFEQPAFHKTDISAGYQTNNKRWSLNVFAKNLENKSQLGAVSASTMFSSAPRTWGASLGYKF